MKTMNFSQILLCEFAIGSNCESERVSKIAKRKRSEVESILCEANSLRFAIFRNRANSHCEFGALILLSGIINGQARTRKNVSARPITVSRFP